MADWIELLAYLQGLGEQLAVLLPPDSPAYQIVLAACTLLLVLIFCRTPSRLALVRQFFLLAAGFAMLALLLALFRLLPDSTTVQLLVSTLCLLLAGGLLGKLVLANRFAALRDARHDARGRLDSCLLPFQARAMHKLLEQAGLAPTPLVVGLQALLGAGKSTVMEHFLRELGVRADRFVAVKLNVWEYEDYDDLQFGAMQTLLAHPKVLEGYGWLDFPLWMLAREWGGLRFRSFEFAWGSNKANADGRLRLPWQSRFERIVARQHLAGRRVVFVLDELERANAPATQGALTLISRSLSQPGLVVVVSFVEEMIRFKAFHPDMVVLEDLRDTVAGHLHNEWLKTQDAHTPDALGSAGSNTDPRRLITQDRALAFNVLAGQFMQQAGSTAWSEYYQQMTERYLRYSVRLGQPDCGDLLAFLTLPEIRVGFETGFGEPKYQALLEWVAQQVEIKDSPLRKIETQIRWLKGDLLKLLSAPVDPTLDPRFFLLLALAMGGNNFAQKDRT